MYERFTDRARKVMQLANQEAQRFNHEYIGTEHILLGLVKEGTGVAANVLKNLDIDLPNPPGGRKDRPTGPDMVTMGKLPQTPRPRKSSNTPSRRHAISTTTTSARNTCCWAFSGSKKAWPLRSYEPWAQARRRARGSP